MAQQARKTWMHELGEDDGVPGEEKIFHSNENGNYNDYGRIWEEW